MMVPPQTYSDLKDRLPANARRPRSGAPSGALGVDNA